jgi:chaperonin GroES
MSFKPLADNVLIQVSDAENESKYGIVMPGEKEKPNKGVVVAIGSGTLVKDGTKFPIEAAEGDIVLFRKGEGTEVDIDGVDHIIVREYDILGIL